MPLLVQVYIARAQTRHLEESSASEYKPLYQREMQDGPWRGYRVGNIGKASTGPIVHDFIITYISEDGFECWGTPLEMQSDSKSTRYGPRQH